ncbi:MAG: DUF1566 domain-containing protein [Desulfobacterota bacterium]|nr:DUF1566 domain-containing protein [Thermodesulfobacteriota bacterium]
MKMNRCFGKMAALGVLSFFHFLPDTARSQLAQLLYSPCLHSPGCFNFCAILPPDWEEPLCEVCQEGAPGVALPRTGQTLCFNSAGQERDCAGTGEDGHLRAGVVWPEPRFVDNQDGTVTDQLTGLIWLQDANCLATRYPAFDNDGTSGDGRVTWQRALDFVREINADTYPDCGAGQSDWRLANINELESLMNAGAERQDTWLLGQGFSNVRIDEMYWSSTTNAFAAHQAWAMEFLMANGARRPFPRRVR